jgi:2-epi-5-epi-valiolone synthase
VSDDLVRGEWVVETNLPIRYTIRNTPGLFDKDNQTLLEIGSRGPAARRFVVIDRHICRWYLPTILAYFKAQNVEVHVLAIDATENHKNLELLLLILRDLEKFGILRRDEPLIAIGGGVLLDVAGMAAGMYRRGIPYIRVPTTLVGLIDASVGAKTGINFEARRNRLGSYYPPVAAYLDRAFLRTLETIEVSSGLGEILKMGVIKDERLFTLLESHGQALLSDKFQHGDYADEVINRAVVGMKGELENNLWETDLRRLVDFGHSFSPIIEMRSISQQGYSPLTHGQAVTLDVLFSCVLSCGRRLMSQDEVFRVARTAKAMMLPTNHPLFNNPLIILEALKDTTKHRNGKQNLPVPIRIGQAMFVNDLSFDEIRSAVPTFLEIHRRIEGER